MNFKKQGLKNKATNGINSKNKWKSRTDFKKRNSKHKISSIMEIKKYNSKYKSILNNANNRLKNANRRFKNNSFKHTKWSISILAVLMISFLLVFKFGEGRNLKEAMNFTKIQISRLEETESLKRDKLFSIVSKISTRKISDPLEVYDKIAYITIDDGPSQYTSQLLDILDKNNVKATFFMIGPNMKTYKDEVKKISDSGNSLGLHSMTHEVKSLYKTEKSTLEEFDTCNDILKEICGYKTRLIRIPYGSKPYMSESIYNSLVQNNYAIWDWNVDTEDWKSNTTQIVSSVKVAGSDKKKLIVLIHEKKQSVKALDDIISVLKSNGYKILPIKESYEPQNFWNNNI
ncbi:MAG: polysaccharide deacetylase [Clostridioides sp.]|nr:polysaccharide deacetylase [Clostridioides sp.]